MFMFYRFSAIWAALKCQACASDDDRSVALPARGQRVIGIDDGAEWTQIAFSAFQTGNERRYRAWSDRRDYPSVTQYKTINCFQIAVNNCRRASLV